MGTWYGIVVGLISLVLGIFPFLNKFGVLSFNLPYTPTGIVLNILLIVSAIIMFIEGFKQDYHMTIKTFLLIFCFLFLVIAGVSLANAFNVLNLTFVDSILSIFYVKNALLMAGGIFMMMGYSSM